MKDVNKIILIGRLGNQPEKKEIKNGVSLVSFSLATSRRAKQLSEDGTETYKEETDWHRIVTWGKTAEKCVKYLNKGETVFIEGRLQIKKYTSPTGESKLSVEVQADNVCFLSSKKPETSETPETATEYAQSA